MLNWQMEAYLLRINKDRSITWIADIINEKQINLSKKDQVTYGKVK